MPPASSARTAAVISSIDSTTPMKASGEPPEAERALQREAEILVRIDRLKRTMNETKAIDTIAFKAKLLREAQDELYRVQDKLAGLSED